MRQRAKKKIRRAVEVCRAIVVNLKLGVFTRIWPEKPKPEK